MSLARPLAPALVVGALLNSLGCSSEVQIGAVISETGAVATYGRQVRRGLDLALEQVNAAGGYDGRTIVLQYRDDATNPERGEHVVRELIERDGVKLILGAVSSLVTLRIAPICEREGVVLLSPTSSAREISAMGEYVFRNYPSDILEGTSMARFAKDEGFERVVIFARDDDFGRGLAETFALEYESKYRQVVQRFRIPKDQTSGFAPLVAETKVLDPDGIYVVTYDEALKSLLTEFHAAGLRAVRLGSAAVPQNIGQLVGPAAERLIYPVSGFELQSNDPAVVSFVERYRAKYGEDPDNFAAHGYDALKLFALALDNAESTNPDDVKLALGAINAYQGAAGRTAFDKNGDVVRYPRLFVIYQGRPMPFDQFAEQGLTLVEPRSRAVAAP